MLQSYLSDFDDAYIVVKGTVTVKADNYERKSLALKNSAPFVSCNQRSIMY